MWIISLKTLREAKDKTLRQAKDSIINGAEWRTSYEWGGKS